MRIIECYDIGGTNIRGALVGDNSRILKSKSVKSKKGDSKALIGQILEISRFLRSKNIRISAVSLGVPGTVVENVLQIAPPLLLYKQLDIISKLKQHMKEPIFIENDLNAAVKAELNKGAGKKVKNFVLLTISTGIGSGIVADGKVLGGACGEFGHDILETNQKIAKEWGCSHQASWGELSSGYGIEQITARKIRKMSPEEFFELCRAGNSTAKQILKRMREYNAHGIGNILNAFPAETIVIMGSVGLKQFKKVIPSAKEIKKYTINGVPKIIPTSLGEDIGILGTYFTALEKLEN